MKTIQITFEDLDSKDDKAKLVEDIKALFKDKEIKVWRIRQY